MSRAKLFIENFFAYGFIGILNQIIPFIFLPIITRLLPDTSDFGVFDMYNVIILFGHTFIMSVVGNAMMREYFEKDEQSYKDNVATTAFTQVLFSAVTIFLLLAIFNRFFSGLLFGNSKYGVIILLCGFAIVVNTTQELFRISVRIQNHRKVFLYSGLLGALSQKVIAIILILVGLTYYGLIFSGILSALLVLAYLWRKYRVFFTNGVYIKTLSREMLRYGLPLLPTSLIFWFYNSIDRFMIFRYLDSAEVGVYGIGARVAMVSQLIFVAFSTGWSYFIYSTMKDRDYKEMMGNLWSLMFAVCTSFYLVVFLSKDMAFNILFTGDYVRGVSVFPYLVLVPLMNIFIYILDTQFIVIKKTYYSPFICGFGCVVNILMNIYLIPRLGIVGAAIATVCGYTVSVLCLIVFIGYIKKIITIPLKAYIFHILFLYLFIAVNILGVSVVSVLLILGYLGLIVWEYGRQGMELYRVLRKR